MTSLNELSPDSLLAYAREISVAVTVDCECPGLIVNGRQFIPEGSNINGQTVTKGYWCGDNLPDGPPPAGVPAELFATLVAREGELVPMLEAAGAWSCGCTVGLTREEIAEIY